MVKFGVARKNGERNPRPISIEGDIGLVPLTRGGIAIIDAADAERIGQMRWSLSAFGYARAAYQDDSGKTDNILMHRLVLGLPSRGLPVDHIDGDKLNNRRSNLRECFHFQNMANRPPQANNSTGFKGVSLCKQTGKYRAILRVNGDTHRIGRFVSPIEAAIAYDAKARDILGEFAWLNFKKGIQHG